MSIDKSNVYPVCNYATFLWDVKKNFDEAEKYYNLALQIDNQSFDTLLNFADFMYEIRDDDDRSEQLFLSGIEIYPNSGIF